jgi:hypothetical protein
METRMPSPQKLLDQAMAAVPHATAVLGLLGTRLRSMGSKDPTPLLMGVEIALVELQRAAGYNMGQAIGTMATCWMLQPSPMAALAHRALDLEKAQAGKAHPRAGRKPRARRPRTGRR